MRWQPGGQKQQVEKVPAIDLANLDTTVSPAADFYRYSTGGWQKNHPLKPEYARFGSFDQLRENNVKRLNDLFAEMGTLKTEKGSVEQKISDLYKQGLDSTRLNAEGAAPLKEYVDGIYAAADKEALVKVIAAAQCLRKFILRGLCDVRPRRQRQSDPLSWTGRSGNRRP